MSASAQFLSLAEGEDVVTTTEEIIVSGDNFIERRIILVCRPQRIDHRQYLASAAAYKRGWVNGILMSVAVAVAVALCVSLAIL